MADLVTAVKNAIAELSAALPAESLNKTIGPATLLAVTPKRVGLYATAHTYVFQLDAGGFDTAVLEGPNDQNDLLKPGAHVTIEITPGAYLYGTDTLVSAKAV